MSARFRTASAALAALALAAAALAGCASSRDTDAAPGGEIEVSAAWLDGGSMIALLLAGSSTCVPAAEDVAYDDGTLTVRLVEPDRPCTRDLVLRGVPVSVPAGVDPAEDLRIELSSSSGGTGVVELAGVAGLTPGSGLEGGEPSAGWASADTVALLTWGSSSCPPEIADAAVTAAGEVTVTVADPPADRACTADFAPRVTPVTVDDAEPGTSYEAVLTGDSFDAVRLPIAGTP